MGNINIRVLLVPRERPNLHFNPQGMSQNVQQRGHEAEGRRVRSAPTATKQLCIIFMATTRFCSWI